MERTIRYLLVLAVVAAAVVGMLFAAAPAIKSVSPVSGFTGTPITITGTGFGATQGTSTVTFKGEALNRHRQLE